MSRAVSKFGIPLIPLAAMLTLRVFAVAFAELCLSVEVIRHPG
ncbi:hypothetical protein BN1232_03012 [Mycobacterium lentiflavum]|uniref:Uncharacterized protein n=1 Tax=Mycobacterium lentiflavum TaxID=141349 RepID=A0A0E4CNI8_MYCLN|nr:hypothetical protein [Mycobacterium lentiflavum]CQD14375.1 hypothetical protein BN1232_03012 [Mycobacterium lentiflavum]